MKPKKAAPSPIPSVAHIAVDAALNARPMTPQEVEAHLEAKEAERVKRAEAAEAAPLIELRVALGDANKNGKVDISARAFVNGKPREAVLVQDIDEGTGMLVMTYARKLLEVVGEEGGVDRAFRLVRDVFRTIGSAGEGLKLLQNLRHILPF